MYFYCYQYLKTSIISSLSLTAISLFMFIAVKSVSFKSTSLMNGVPPTQQTCGMQAVKLYD